jgi:alkylated DNA repair dioxygenase AlkB
MIPGLSYHADALTDAQEQALLSYMDEEGKWAPVTDSDKSRRVQHYGYRYDYKRRTASEPTTVIPVEWTGLLGLLGHVNQVIVNEYLPGQGISAHVDSLAYGNTIQCYTLGSGATMRFTHVETGEKKDLYVAPRSLYTMSGEARYRWKHEMIGRKSDIVGDKRVLRGRRVSVTLRALEQ